MSARASDRAAGMTWGVASEAVEPARRDVGRPVCELCGEDRPALLCTTCWACNDVLLVEAQARRAAAVARAIWELLVLLAVLAVIFCGGALLQIQFGKGGV